MQLASVDRVMSSTVEASSTVSMCTEHRISKRSLVWEYFLYDEDTAKSICQVEDCGRSLSGKNPTNLKNHLKAYHKNVFQQLCKNEEADKAKKEKAESKKQAASLKHQYQATLKESLSERTVYSRESPQYKAITKKLAIFVGTSNVANSLVESLEFQDLLASLDPRYPIPGRTLIHKEIEELFTELKANISSYLNSASKIAITCDVWSKKGLTSSYLGITGHFFSTIDDRRHVVTLAVRRIMASHTAVNIREICESVLSEWDIDQCKVSAIITDNCSNMVAAFKQRVGTLGTEEDEQTDSEDEEVPVIDDEFEADFNAHEEEHDTEFVSYCHLGCFSHTLQLVVSRFQEITTYSDLLKHAHSIVEKFNTSTKATERLISLSKKKLRKDTPVRWSSTFLMIERMLELKDNLKIVLEEQGWDDLVASDWEILESIKDLLSPFAKFTQLLSGDEFSTLSCVVPALMELDMHLDESKNDSRIAEAAKKLQGDLHRRFIKYTSPSVENFNPIMIAATSVDLRYRLCLNSVQVESATKYLETLVKESKSSISGSSSLLPSEDCNPPPQKKFKLLDAILEKKLGDTSKHRKSSKWKAELELFQQTDVRMQEDQDPLNFWIDNERKYPLISSICKDLLCIPASSAPIERTFSTAGESTSGKRNRLTDQNLEREILLRKNKHFFGKLNSVE